MMDIDKILKERASTHGSYVSQAQLTQALKDVLKKGKKWGGLASTKKEALEMICHKIGRILAGDATYRDHWDDIAGYATLVARLCNGPCQRQSKNNED